MNRPSRQRDFYDADVPTDADPSPLRRVILAQAEAPGGAVVVLFSTPTLASPIDIDPGAAEFVRRAAAELGLPHPPDLFSPDAYLLQSALGERLVDARPIDRSTETGITAEAPSGPTTSTEQAWTDQSWTDQHSTALLHSPVIAVNYHDIEPQHRDDVEATLRRVSRVGSSVAFGVDDPEPGPRILVGFWDGYSPAGLFGADVCQRLGIRACFFPLFDASDEPGTGELTDDELRQIADVHEIGFHTAGHVAADEVTDETAEREVRRPLRRIESITGMIPRVGAWRGGARFDDRRLGDRILRDSGVTSMVSNWSLERIPPIRGNLEK